MNKVFVTYSNELYAKTRNFCGKMAEKKGEFDRTVIYSPIDIDEKFKRDNELILSQERGAGLWLWKPYFIYKALCEEVLEGDILFYGDAGSFFFRSCKHIVESMGNEDIWVSNIPLMEKQFTKEDAFQIMDCNNETIRNSAQIQGNFICLRKSTRSISFIKEWLAYCSNYNLLADDPATQKSANCLEYLSHRYDQSILSLLSKKWGLKPHLDPSQYGLFSRKYYYEGRILVDTNNECEYKPCIILHRSKKLTLLVLFRSLLNVYLPANIVRYFSLNYNS